MRINNNLMAMNTHRQLGVSNNSGAKSMEKLSSGFRINRAGDDAAGLSISEKMRGQIRGLTQASRNAQDGISMIQTAEGALNETQAILQRMRELAVQSSSDTNVNELDREAIDNEFNKLKEEIDRIGNTTEFNTQKLLNGGAKAPDKLTAKATGTGEVSLTDIPAKAEVAGEWTVKIDTVLGDGDDIEIGGVTITGADNGTATGELDTVANTTQAQQAAAIKDLLDADATFSGQYDVAVTGDTLTITEKAGKATGTALAALGGTDAANATQTETTASVKGVAGGATLEITTAFADGDTLEIGGQTYTFKAGGTGDNEIDVTTENDATKQATALAALLSAQDGITATATAGKITIEQAEVAGEGFEATLQIGANETQTMDISIGDMRAEALGIDEVSLATGADARTAITTINDAINKVSTQRSELGAFQNRLEHTIKNLDNSAENLQAAEARIRDVDMAKEMMEQTKQNILSQAATAMLAQANQQPQGVLQLLR